MEGLQFVAPYNVRKFVKFISNPGHKLYMLIMFK